MLDGFESVVYFSRRLAMALIRVRRGVTDFMKSGVGALRSLCRSLCRA